MKKLTTRAKLLLALGLILTVSFVGISLLNYVVTRADVRREILLNDLPLTRDNIYSEISSELMRPLMVASSMANDSFLKEWAEDGEADLGKITRYLAGIQEKYGFFSAFFVSARTGSYYHFKGLLKTVTDADDHDMWFYRFIASGKEHVLDVDTDEAANDILTIFINFRVVDDSGRLLGVTGVGLKMDAVARMVRQYMEKYGRLVYLVDSKGLVVVHPDTSLIEKADINGVPGMAALARDMLACRSEPGNFQYSDGGREVLLTVRYVPELDWFIFVEQDEAKALATARGNFLRTVLLGLGASAVVVFLTLLTINSYQNRLEAMAVTDELTGAGNRRRLEMEFDRALALKRRHGRDFCLVILDLDGFKPVNDKAGHLAGDKVLRDVAGLITRTVRPMDVLARWGGDEFVLMAEGGGEQAASMAERLREAVEAEDLAGPGAGPDDPRRRLTVCAGVAQCSPGDDLDSLLRKADQAMYRCKAQGGNRCALA